MRRASLVVLVIFHVAALAAPLLAPFDPTQQHRDMAFAPPTRIHFRDASGALAFPPVVNLCRQPRDPGTCDEDRTSEHRVQLFAMGRLLSAPPEAPLFLWGTDAFGRDVLSRALVGARYALLAGWIGTIVALGLGLVLGAAAGVTGGFVDAAIMQLTSVFLAVPWLYLLLTLRAFLPLDASPTMTLLLIVCVLGGVGWAPTARLVRGIARDLRERDHVVLARSFGATWSYVARRHAWPPLARILNTQGAFLLPQFAVAEATLSFLGLGISEPQPSWGTLLSTLTQYHVLQSYVWMAWPLAPVLLLCLSFHFALDTAGEATIPIPPSNQPTLP